MYKKMSVLRSTTTRAMIFKRNKTFNLARIMSPCWPLLVNWNGKSVKWVVAWLVVLSTWNVQIGKVHAFSPLWDSVKTQVFQEYEIISTRGQISVVRAKLGEFKTPNLVVGENVKQSSRLILTCTAWYPSEWVYSGDADPTYNSNTTIENLGPNGQVLPLDDVNGAKRYVATIVIGPRGVKQSDTGRYNCMTASPETGMKFKTLSAYYHLFVPGKSLFIRKRGGTILYDLRKSPARIPCGVTNPRVAVSLQKFQNGHLVNVDNETMLYHPISGFYPRHDIPGTYVCTAAHNKAFELLHFTLVPKIADSATVQNIKQSSEEDLDWLFNSFKLGHSNRIRLSTRPPSGFTSQDKRKKPKPRPTLSASYNTNSAQKQSTEFNSVWKQPSPEDHDDDAVVASPGASNGPGSTYRPVYVLFAEDLNRLKAKTTERPNTSLSGSGSASTSASGSDESEEEAEGKDEEQEQEKEEQTEEVESTEDRDRPNSNREKEPNHQYHFDPTSLSKDNQLLLHQLFSTQEPTLTTTSRPAVHREYATTYLPFLNFLNQNSAVVKYKPVINPAESIIKYSDYGSRKTTTSRPHGHGQIVYDLQSNRLVYHESGFTRPATERPTRPSLTSRPNKFRIPSLPTQRWPTTRRTARPTTKRPSTTSTTPAPPLIPDAVVCVNSPCGKHATCYANTVYYHKQKETRREPACKCIDNYHGNPYLECQPPSAVETDFLSFNSSNLFEKRNGMAAAAVASLEEGYLHNSDIFPLPSDEPIIVDAKKKK